MATRKTSSKTTKKAAKTPPEPVVIPPWPDISEEALQALAVKIDKAKDSYRVSDMICKVNGDEWGSRHSLAWHLVACRAIHPETNPNVLEFIGEEPEKAAPEVVLDVLVRLPPPSTKKFFANYSKLMDGYTLTMDRLLFDTYRRAPDLVRAREAELNAALRRGLAFIRGRLGETIAPEMSAAILQQLATHQTSGYGIASNHEMPVMENGELVKPRLADLAAVKKLAMRFGAEKEWNDAFLAAALEGKWQNPRNVRDAFMMATTAQLVQLVNRSGLDTGDTLRTLIEVIPQRDDDPQTLLEAALPVEEERMRDMLLMGVVYRAGKTGMVMPEKLDESLTYECLDTSYDGVRTSCVEWFKVFPRERALAAARRCLQLDYQYARAVGILGAHFDEEILRAALEKDIGKNYIGAETLGGLGANGLPLLEWSYEKTEGDGRRQRHRAILHAMVKAAETGPIDERWEKYIDMDLEGGQPIQYYGSGDATPREMALKGIPEPRRTALLMKRLATAQHPERILPFVHLSNDAALINATMRRLLEMRKIESGFRTYVEKLGEPAVAALCEHIGLSKGDGRFLESLKRELSHTMYERIEAALEKTGIRKETPRDALERMAAEVEGTKERIYVLQVGRDGYEPKEGTLARSGGNAPGIVEADIPKDKSGEPMTHLFTLDLDEMPELQQKYEGARALAAFCPEPNSGDRSDELELVPISREAVVAWQNTGDDEDDEGTPICIAPLDVPSAIFERVREDGPLKDIRKMIFNAAGHVFGEPFWIQDDEGGGDFILQINDGLCDVNLGDCGSLYVFGWGTVFQCY